MIAAMRIFGLTPSSVLERSNPADIKPQPTLAFSVLYGSLSFGAVSVLAYAIWAFRLVPGIAAMYAVIALIYRP